MKKNFKDKEIKKKYNEIKNKSNEINSLLGKNFIHVMNENFSTQLYNFFVMKKIKETQLNNNDYFNKELIKLFNKLKEIFGDEIEKIETCEYLIIPLISLYSVMTNLHFKNEEKVFIPSNILEKGNDIIMNHISSMYMIPDEPRMLKRIWFLMIKFEDNDFTIFHPYCEKYSPSIGNLWKGMVTQWFLLYKKKLGLNNFDKEKIKLNLININEISQNDNGDDHYILKEIKRKVKKKEKKE